MLRIGGLTLVLTLSFLGSGGALNYGVCTTRCSRTEVIQWQAASYSACCNQETTYCSDGVPRTGNSYIPPGGDAVKCGSF
jgi:hypothetical protein